MVSIMADLRGRCMNVEFCSVAVSQRVVTLPEGSDFACPKCGEPLQEADAARQAGRGRALIGLQVLILLAGGGAIAYKLTGRFDADPGQPPPAIEAAAPAPDTPPVVAAALPPAPAPVQQAYQPPSAPVPAPAPVPVQQAYQPPPAPVQPAPVQPAPVQPAPVQQASQPPAPVAPPAPTPVLAMAPPTPAPAPVAAPAKPAGTELFRMAGSDVIGNRLARRLASGYLALIGDTNITLTPTGTEGVVEVAGLQTGERELITVASTGSAAGFTALLRGSADFAMSAKRISPAELERLASLGDLSRPGSENVIALQGLAAIVNPASRVPSLSMTQLRAILSGQVVDWSELDNPPGRINVYVLDSRGGRVDTTHDFVLGEGSTLLPTARVVASETALASAVTNDRNGIGIVTLASTGLARVLAVSDNGAAAIEPNDLAISTENYPLTRRLYLYTSPKPSNLFVRRFLDYVASPTGQAAVEAAGFVSLTVKAETAAVPEAASDRFRGLISGATRVSVDFRFQPGSMELDSRGQRDMERFISYVRTQRIPANRIILAGFADNNGSPAANMVVSQRRAEVVAAALGRAGITPGKLVPFGADLPVADNSTAEGRERNRRVEVYIAP